MRPVLVVAALVLLVSCGPRRLETRIDGRAAESLQAEAERVEGGWRVSLRLPAGRWRVKVEGEDQAIRVLEGDPFALARWDVSGARFAASDRPLRLVLQGEQLTLPIQVVYRRAHRWTDWLLLSVARGGVGVVHP